MLVNLSNKYERELKVDVWYMSNVLLIAEQRNVHFVVYCRTGKHTFCGILQSR